MVKQAMIDYVQNEKNDVLFTPAEAVYPLIKHLVLPKGSTVWECTDRGGSKITEVLTKVGYKVISTDIVTGFDFLKDAPDFHFDAIITNPPYSIKDAFLNKCYDYDIPFGLLLPLTALEGVARGKMYREYGIDLLVLDRRINFMEKKKSVWFNTSWFSLGLVNYPLIFEEVDRDRIGKGV